MPRAQDDRLQRAERLGQELAGDRHALRRGPAALRREPLELRPAVPRPAAEAEGRADHAACRRPSASSRRRPARARARPSAPSPRSTTTCASSSPGSASRTARRCGMPIGTQTADEIVEKVLHLPEGTKVYVMAPVERRDGEDVRRPLGRAPRLGVRPGPGRRPVGQPRRAAEAEPPPQAPGRGGGRSRGRPPRRPGRGWPTRSRRRSTWARGSCTSPGSATRRTSRTGTVDRYSQHRVCDGCGRSFEELSPHHFSFNSPLGWCPVCEGLGAQQGANPAVLIRDGRRSLRDGRGRRLARLRREPDVRPDDRGAGRGAGDRPRHAVRRARGPAPPRDPPRHRRRPGSPSRRATASPSSRSSTRASSRRSRRRRGSRSSTGPSSRGWSTTSRAPRAWARRLRDDAAAVRFRDFTIDQVGQWPLGRALRVLQGAEARAATSGTSPATWSARSATA